MKRDAISFLDEISTNDSILIIHHTDLDGMASGILLYDYCKNKTNKIKNMPFNYGQKIKYNKYKKYNKIITADLSDKEIEPAINEFLKQEKQVLFIDHHKNTLNFSKKVMVYRCEKNKYIPCSRMIQEITNEKSWLAVAGTIADFGQYYSENKKYINDFLKNKKQNIEEYQKEIVFTLTDSIVYFDKNLEKICEKIKKISEYSDVKKLKKYSKKIETEIERQIKIFKEEKQKFENIYFFEIKPKYRIKSIVISNLSLQEPDKAFIFLQKDKNTYNLSARNHSGNINLSQILNFCTKNFENSSFGGHDKAIGGHFPKKYLSEFIHRLSLYKMTNYRR